MELHKKYAKLEKICNQLFLLSLRIWADLMITYDMREIK